MSTADLQDIAVADGKVTLSADTLPSGALRRLAQRLQRRQAD